MNTIARQLLYVICLQATLALAAPATPQPSSAAFVQRFFDWYLPLLDDDSRPDDPAAIALQERKDAFAPSLAAALRADLDASAADSDEVVGLDADPFLDTQDPCERYQVGKAIESAQTATVAVFAICHGKREKVPSILVTLSRRGDSWVFADFGTPSEPHDLTETLHELALERAERGKPR